MARARVRKTIDKLRTYGMILMHLNLQHVVIIMRDQIAYAELVSQI